MNTQGRIVVEDYNRTFIIIIIWLQLAAPRSLRFFSRGSSVQIIIFTLYVSLRLLMSVYLFVGSYVRLLVHLAIYLNE